MGLFDVNDNNVTNFNSRDRLHSTECVRINYILSLNKNTNKNNVDLSAVSPSSTPTNVEMDLVMERAIITAV